MKTPDFLVSIYSVVTKSKVRDFFTVVFFVLSVIFCFSTYVILSNMDVYKKSSRIIITLLHCDIVSVLILLLLGSHKITELWLDWNKKGSRFTLRLIIVFSFLSIVPSVMMIVFSAVFFHNGIDSWFNERNKRVLTESLNVAESYMAERKKNALLDCMEISEIIQYKMEKSWHNYELNFNNAAKEIGFLLDDLCRLKDVKAAIILDSSLNVIARTKYSVALYFLNINYSDLQYCIDNGNIVLSNQSNDKQSIVAVSCITHGGDEGYRFLVIRKKLDSSILAHAENTRAAFDEYHSLFRERRYLEILFIFMFLVMGILLLVAAIVIALVYSWRIIKPVSNLIDVSENIIKGNTDARAHEDCHYEELSMLAKTFNNMVDRVNCQRQDLIKINHQLDEKMMVTSGVLAGVSSGVIGVDNDAVFMWNAASEKLLGKKIGFGECIYDVIPKIKEIVSRVSNSGNNPNSFTECEIYYSKGNEMLMFLVRVEFIDIEDKSHRMFVVTFDDLTQMILAQRKAALSDLARRVAHEIKNPLTPIQLSAEILKRKYLAQISTGREAFCRLVDVIIRQVDDIKRLVNSFTFFARLPESKLKKCDIVEVCRQAVFFMQNATDIKINLSHDIDNSCAINGDERLLHQSIVNIIQNSINALNITVKDDKNIWVSVRYQNPDKVFIVIEDNGPGFPEEKMEQLATPYFTLTPKGTGLGLAIVKKIIQDHSGELRFSNRKTGGAMIEFVLNAWR
ncbi:MAG: GHKL domain-containing protein [Holosporaceae bacterium]|jgi:two-component system nitrogen regulation sensor histidine kinase NtrY|nr:GHKL domain-containing protein [Holosporaceae bacterium]